MTRRRHVDVRPRCRSDVLDCADLIYQDSPASARRFVAAFEDAMYALAEFPFSGGIVEFGSDALRDCRAWTVPGFRNWLIIYRVTDESVDALRVVHGARSFRDLES